VPAAALIADRLAREVDFFAIGTNDLIQYALAVDRNNEHVAYLYQPLHPAILRMLRFVIDSARTAGIDVSLCGEMAADPALTPLLLGLGLRRLSITPRALPEIKARVRSLEVRRLTALAERCLDASSAAEVEALLASELAVVS
jgi:phosphotransferase system enzyme I (PtsI)